MKQDFYWISFLIYAVFSAILLISSIITIIRIAIMENNINNNERCSYWDLKLQKFAKNFVYKNLAFQFYMYYSGFFSLVTLITYSKKTWWVLVIYAFWFLGRVSYKILNMINAGFYYKSIRGSIGETFVWLPYFIILYLHTYNQYKIEWFNEYLNESSNLPYNNI